MEIQQLIGSEHFRLRCAYWKAKDSPPVNSSVALVGQKRSLPSDTVSQSVDTEQLREEADKKERERVVVNGAQWKLKRVVQGHGGTVTALDIDPENHWIATGCADSLLRIFDLASGKLRFQFSGHVEAIRGVSVSTLSPYLYSCGEDKMVKCWDLNQNVATRDFFGHLSAVYCVKAHPCQHIIVTGGRDATVRVWDLRTRRAVHVLEGHLDSVYSLVVQSSTPEVISGGSDGLIHFWDIRSGGKITCLTRHKKPVRALCAHQVENSLCSVGADAVRKWKLPLGEYLDHFADPPLEQGGTWCAAALSPNNVLAVASEEGNLRFYNWSSRQIFQNTLSKKVPGSHEGGVRACIFDGSGTRFITAESDKTLKFWSERTPDG